MHIPPPYIQPISSHFKSEVPYENTGQKIVRILLDAGTLHVSFAFLASRNATRNLVEQSGNFLKMQLQGELWDNSEELQKLRGICGQLWAAYSALWKLLVSRQLRMKSKENAWTCNAPTSYFRGLHDFLDGLCPAGSHISKMHLFISTPFKRI